MDIVRGVPLVHGWNGEANRAVDALGGDKVEFVLPEEGYAIWLDCLSVPVGARSPYGAHLFIDFMLEGENAADLVNYVQCFSPNAAGRPYLRPEVSARMPAEDELTRGETIEDVGAFATAYSDAWAHVKGTQLWWRRGGLPPWARGHEASRGVARAGGPATVRSDREGRWLKRAIHRT